MVFLVNWNSSTEHLRNLAALCSAASNSSPLFAGDHLYGEMLDRLHVQDEFCVCLVHSTRNGQIDDPSVLLHCPPHPFEVRWETMSDRIEFVRDDLIGFAQERVFSCMNHGLMKFRIHALGRLDILCLDSERTSRDLFGHGGREPLGMIR
jgi:hypothetical protein